MMSKEEKLLVPYIERFNGNLLVQAKEFEKAVAHYNKSLLSMQMLFKMQDNPVIETKEQAVTYIKEIEILVCVNLAYCYLQLQEYHHTIKYCSQALEKDEENVKALYRMGLAYTRIGELNKARETFNKVAALETDEAMKNSVTKALQEVKKVE